MYAVVAMVVVATWVVCEPIENKPVAGYDPGLLLLNIFNGNNTVTSRETGKSFVFEGDPENLSAANRHPGIDSVVFEEQGFIHRGQRFTFDDKQHDRPKDHNFLDDSNQPGYGLVRFQNENDLSEQFTSLKKKRRRRRKPRVGPNQGYPGFGNPDFSRPGFPGYTNGQLSHQGIPSGQFYRPPPPKPSVTSQAVSAVTEALTSVALYDDLQCVPRLLCEAAGGGALGAPGVLQSVAGVQPLLMLLSAYSGISTSPLFLFGRAVFLGMTSKGNVAACRYAYPQCPTDPEKLIYYLNNHNGGFFKFFNTPQISNFQYGPQYGPNIPGQNAVHANPNFYQNHNNYGLYNPIENNGPNSQGQVLDYTNPYGYGFTQNYGLNNQLYKNNNDLSNNRIERRIQNKPNDIDVNQNSKWLFPVNINNDNRENTINLPAKDNIIKNQNNSVRQSKTFQFPGRQTFREYMDQYLYRPFMSLFTYNNDNDENYDNSIYSNNNNNNEGNYQNNNDKYGYTVQNQYQNSVNAGEDGFVTLYVVRGNGDPKHPEVIKVRPGQKIY